MACYYHCDGCTTHKEAVRPGMYNLVPEGWFVGRAPGHTFELYACSVGCFEPILRRLDVGVAARVTWKPIMREPKRSKMVSLCSPTGDTDGNS